LTIPFFAGFEQKANQGSQMSTANICQSPFALGEFYGTLGAGRGKWCKTKIE
jgi:hypothetical protein